MRILVVSDTHGNENMLLKAHQLAGQVDAIIHTGDGEQDTLLLEHIYDGTVLRVAGNCDHGSTAPRELLVTLAGTRLLITHGDSQLVKNGLERLYEYGKSLGAQAILFGHTHQALAEQRQELFLLNPGTLWGRAPFLSFAILELHDGQVTASIHQLE